MSPVPCIDDQWYHNVSTWNLTNEQRFDLKLRGNKPVPAAALAGSNVSRRDRHDGDHVHNRASGRASAGLSSSYGFRLRMGLA